MLTHLSHCYALFYSKRIPSFIGIVPITHPRRQHLPICRHSPDKIPEIYKSLLQLLLPAAILECAMCCFTNIAGKNSPSTVRRLGVLHKKIESPIPTHHSLGSIIQVGLNMMEGPALPLVTIREGPISIPKFCDFNGEFPFPQLPVLEHANAALCCVLFEQLDYRMNTFPGFHHLRQYHLCPNCSSVVMETILQPLDVVLQARNVDCHPTSSDNPVDVVLRKKLRSHSFKQHVLNVLN